MTILGFRFTPFLVLIFSLLGLLSCKNDPSPDDLIGSPQEYANEGVGFAAEHLLADEEFSHLKVEFLVMPGMDLSSTAENYVLNFLNDRIYKSQITFLNTQIPSRGGSSYSVNDIDGIENDFRSQYNSGDTLTVSVVLADKPYSENSGNGQVLGIAYRSTSLVLFQETIEENTGGILEPSRSLLESTVLAHEFGHILGLVNNGVPMQEPHQDSDHGKHCDVEDCLMYYTVETTQSLSNLAGGSVPELDPQCVADLRAKGGK